MSNCALLVFDTMPRDTTGKAPLPSLYLHWNGGPESVYAFVAATMHAYHEGRPCHDMSAFAARMIETCCRFHSDGLSSYVSAVNRSDLKAGKWLDNIDPGCNGVYYFHGVKCDRARHGRWFTEEEKVREREAAIASEEYRGILAEVLKSYGIHSKEEVLQ